MNTTYSNRPSISTIVQEQRKYSVQQLSKLQQSNHKLDQLEEKMKSLLERDNRNKSKSNFHIPMDSINSGQPNSDQVNRYFESSKKYKPNNQCLDDRQNDDLLLDNHEMEENHTTNKRNQKQFQFYQDNRSKVPEANFVNKAKREKSTTSLKIFNKKSTKLLNTKPFAIGNQNNSNLSKFNSKNSKSISFGNYDSRKMQENITNINKPLNKNIIQKITSASIESMIHPHSDIYEINQLQLMMQKSLEIKEKQLILFKKQLLAFEDAKVNEYRKNTESQVHLQNIKKFRNDFRIMGKNQKISKFSTNDPEIQILCEDVTKQKDELENVHQKLLKQLKQLQDEEYQLKLQKKRVAYEFSSLERQFQKVLKHHAKRQKENIPNNQQKSLIQNEESTQRLLPKRNPSVKSVKTHKKKHFLSIVEPRQSTQYHYQKYLQPQSTKRSSTKPKQFTIKSKQKQPLGFNTKAQENSKEKRKVFKSTSCSGIHNRHALSSCQAQFKNCTTDKVLIEMVHELDKLKDVVNREIVKTRNGQRGERRVIQLIR